MGGVMGEQERWLSSWEVCACACVCVCVQLFIFSIYEPLATSNVCVGGGADTKISEGPRYHGLWAVGGFECVCVCVCVCV